MLELSMTLAYFFQHIQWLSIIQWYKFDKHQVILDNVYKHLNTYLMIHYKHDAYNRHIYFV